MAVIINEFEMITGGEEKTAAKPAAPAEATQPPPQAPAPKDLVAVFEHEAKRLFRIFAH